MKSTAFFSLATILSFLALPACDADPADAEQGADAGVVAEGCIEGNNAGLTDVAFSFEDVEAGRYCEVLVIYPEDDGTIMADVYNSLPFGDCPQELWIGLDAEAIAADFPDATSILLNGPRYFLMQDLFGSMRPDGVPMVHDFGGIQMIKAATVEASNVGQMSYTKTTVNRSNTWRFTAGTRVHELIDDEGNIYVMQSFSRFVDSELTFDELENLGARIEVPEGWRYRVRTLDAHLDVQADGTATVLQDELQNTYQWRSDCQITE